MNSPVSKMLAKQGPGAKSRAFSDTKTGANKGVVPKVGVEPTQGCPQRFLRPSRLPFRHFGLSPILYLKCVECHLY